VTMRGGRQPDATTVTIAARGELAEPAARAELIALMSGARS
jgi:GTP cyclohydrolase I